MALGAAACFAVYLLATERVRNSIGTLAFLRLAMVSSTVVLFLRAGTFTRDHHLHKPADAGPTDGGDGGCFAR